MSFMQIVPTSVELAVGYNARVIDFVCRINRVKITSQDADVILKHFASVANFLHKLHNELRVLSQSIPKVVMPVHGVTIATTVTGLGAII